MKTLLRKNLLLLTGLFLFTFAGAQKKLLILGSSTSTCFFGPSSVDSCYVTRLQKYYQDIGSAIIVDNRAVGGDNCYQGMPTNMPPPPGRNSPRPYNNITDGLQGNPDVVLVNYPSNGYDTYSVEEVINCLRTIKQTANNAGKPCYITTSQPRSDPESYRTDVVRMKMAEIKDRILSEFGAFAINFWDGIVNPADNSSILDIYNADGIHLNNAGHRLLFNRVLERNMFATVPVSNGNGLTYKYYEGNWNSLPDFNSLQPVKSGTVPNIDVSPRNRGDYYAFLWEGFINIPFAGNYTFELVSDDGSKLYFNSMYSAGANALVNNDGLHAAQSASNTVFVNAPGAYPVAISFFQNGGGEQLQLYWSGPGIPRQLVPTGAFSNRSTAGGGLKYKYYEGDWNELPNFNALQPVKSGAVNNVDMSPRTRGDYYGFLWEGYIKIPAAGSYTFELVSDDGSKLYFNTFYDPGVNALVSNDGLHAGQSASASINVNVAGSYPIAITFFEKAGGEQMQVFWSGPGFSRQPVPNEAFSREASSSGNALKYRYYEGDWSALPDFNALQPVRSGSSANIDMSPRNRNDYFAFLWEGYITIPSPGYYTFELVSDDGSKLYFNSWYNPGSNALVNNDGLHAGQANTGSINIGAAGKYPIAISFFENTGNELMQVYWSGPGFSRQPIPNEAFSDNASLALVSTEKIAVAQLNAGLSENMQTIKTYPNPFTESFDIALHTTGGNNNISAGLYDVSGKRVYVEYYKNIPAGNNKLRVNLNERCLVTEGVYFLKVDINGIPFKVIKLVKSKG